MELPRDFAKNRKYDEKIVRTLYGIADEINGEVVHVLIEDMKTGKLPPLKDWYWDTYLRVPCYIKDNQVYAFSEDVLGEFDYMGTLDEYRKECDARIRLTEYGKARMKYLSENSYGTWFGMLCRGELWEHCKEVEDEANEREEQMMFARMRQFESRNDTDPIGYGKIWNNERASVREVIFRELIYG